MGRLGPGPAGVYTDDGKQLIGLENPDGSVSLMQPFTNEPRNNILKIAVFGDSNATTGDQTTPANNDTSLFIYAPPVAANVPVTMAMSVIGLSAVYPVAQFVTNCGVGGRTVATMVSDETGARSISSREVIDCANNDPDVIIYRGGSINDLTGFSYTGGVVNESSYQTLVTNHKTVLNRIITLGAVVLDCGIYGFNQGLAGYPASPVGTDPTGAYVRATIVRFNAEIKAYITSLNNPRVVFIDHDGVISDAGVIRTGYTLLTDGKHLNGAGGIKQGLSEKSVIEGIFGKSRKYRYAGKNVQTNPLFASSAGNIPTGYAQGALGNVTASTKRIGDLAGDIWWTGEYIASAAGTVTMGMQVPFNPTATGLNVQIGDVYGVEVDFRAENLTTRILTEVKRIRPRLSLFNTANTFQVYSDFCNFDDADTGSTHTGVLELHLAHTPVKFNDAAASWGTNSVLDISFSSKALTAGEVFKIGISNPRIVKLA